MIERSLVKFLNGKGIPTYLGHTMFEISKIQLPFCLVTQIGEYQEKLIYISDNKRKVESEYQIDVYGRTYDEMVRFEKNIRRLLRTNITKDQFDNYVRGIDLYQFYQLLESEDNRVFYSKQKGWFEIPQPEIYKVVNGNFIRITEGYLIDYDNGLVIFDTEQENEIRATYKCGVVDFDEESVFYLSPDEVQDRKLYIAYITLKPFAYFKLTENLI